MNDFFASDEDFSDVESELESDDWMSAMLAGPSEW